MERITSGLLELVRAGERIGELESVDQADLVKESCQSVETASTRFSDTNTVIREDRCRLPELLENLLRYAAENGGEEVTETVGYLL